MLTEYLQSFQFDPNTTLGVRFDLYLMSLDSFWNNPIFGLAHKQMPGSEIMVGNHSEWFDLLAKYGIFGLLMAFFFILVRKKYFKNKGFAIAFFLFFALGFINPLQVFTIYFAAFYYVPKIVCFSSAKGKQTESIVAQ